MSAPAVPSSSAGAGAPARVFVTLVGEGAFADVSVRGDDTASTLLKRACSELKWRPRATQLTLHVAARGGREPEPRDLERALAAAPLPADEPVGGLGGAWLVARAVKVTPFTLIASVADARGEGFVDKRVRVVASSQDDLDRLARLHGGGSLVRAGDACAVDFADLVVGGDYELIGGLREAVSLNRSWTQVEDRVDERAAAEAIADALKSTTGSAFDVRTGVTIVNAAGQEKEIDGVLVGASTVVVMEATHAALLGDVDRVLSSRDFVETGVRDGRLEFFKTVVSASGAKSVERDSTFPQVTRAARFLPALASRLVPPEVLELCALRGVGVAKPNGRGISFFPAAAAAAARRGICTVARIVRALR